MYIKKSQKIRKFKKHQVFEKKILEEIFNYISKGIFKFNDEDIHEITNLINKITSKNENIKFYKKIMSLPHVKSPNIFAFGICHYYLNIFRKKKPFELSEIFKSTLYEQYFNIINEKFKKFLSMKNHNNIYNIIKTHCIRNIYIALRKNHNLIINGVNKKLEWKILKIKKKYKSKIQKEIMKIIVNSTFTNQLFKIFELEALQIYKELINKDSKNFIKMFIKNKHFENNNFKFLRFIMNRIEEEFIKIFIIVNLNNTTHNF